MSGTSEIDATARALESLGQSSGAVLAMVEGALRRVSSNEPRLRSSGRMLDVGCGQGALLDKARPFFADIVGTDIVKHDRFPEDIEFHLTHLDEQELPFEAGMFDVVTCVETIEHVENPRQLVRQLVRVLKPQGWLMVTTPNQLSVASKVCLLARDQFLAFQEAPGLYPAHISALLESDLLRIARENGLESVSIHYTGNGRVPLSARHWPSALSRRRGRLGRLFSDNIMLIARRPAG